MHCLKQFGFLEEVLFNSGFAKKSSIFVSTRQMHHLFPSNCFIFTIETTFLCTLLATIESYSYQS